MSKPADALKRILEILDRLGIHYFIGGSVASSRYGIPRMTMDVDVIADIHLDQADEFFAEVQGDFACDLKTIREALQTGRSFNLIHMESAYKIDIFPVGTGEFNRSQLARRRFDETHSVGEAIECAIASAEDTVLSKLRWYRQGGETSERQWNDLRGILAMSKATLDFDYLRLWAPRIGVGDLLERLLSEKPSTEKTN